MKTSSKSTHAIHRAWFLAAACISVVLPLHGQAQTFPDRPLKITMPWGDGFPANSTRLYSKVIAEALKQPVVVEVKAGAGGEIAARYVQRATPDGYTLLATGTSVVTASASRSANIDPVNELQPLGQLITTPYVVVAQAGKFGNFRSVLEAARKQPGKLNYASPGMGTGMHFLGELIKTQADIDVVHVPYATGAAQLNAILAGDVDIAIISLVSALPQIKAGKIEALAVSTLERSKVVPTVPTLAESGVPGLPSIASWIALFAPKDLPAPVARKISQQIVLAAADPKVQETVASWGAEIPNPQPAYLAKVVREESAVWKKLAREKRIVDLD